LRLLIPIILSSGNLQGRIDILGSALLDLID